LKKLVENLRQKGRQNYGLSVRLVEEAIGQMDEKARIGIYEVALAAKAAQN
jgi:hypothetical protein